jgi:hypothetical protein
MSWRTALKIFLAGNVILPALLLSGCVSTIFESPPGDKTTPCDTRWVGTWELHPADAAVKDEDRIILSVEPGCNVLRFTDNGKLQHDLDHATVLFAELDKASILALRLPASGSNNDSKPSEWNLGYHYFSYIVQGSEIHVRQIDDEKVAHLIVDDKLPGRTEKITRYPGAHQPSDGRNLQNFVAGSAQDMTQALAAYPLFFDKGAIIFKRIVGDPVKSIPDKASAAKSAATKTNQP